MSAARPGGIDRQQFIALALGGGFTLLLGGCGGGGDPPVVGQPQGCGSALSFSANHGHELLIPLADLDSTVDRIYTTGGAATHQHAVTVTAAQFAALRAGNTVALLTAAGGPTGHTHDVAGRCSA